MGKSLTEMERQISEAAWRAYRENLRLIWNAPESKVDAILGRRALSEGDRHG